MCFAVFCCVFTFSFYQEQFKEYEDAAQSAQKEFYDELGRNKMLLEELKTRKETLEKETANLKRLVDKDTFFEKPGARVSAEI